MQPSQGQQLAQQRMSMSRVNLGCASKQLLLYKAKKKKNRNLLCIEVLWLANNLLVKLLVTIHRSPYFVMIMLLYDGHSKSDIF
ncbi:unnamed protein product [Brugia timori]|uniref:Ovule protein n=1 Tax=Brugia timori TaxID=42155 RepID=A0A0R3Q3X0_9BILA|nr:unnamed protein product [Brugia timori]